MHMESFVFCYILATVSELRRWKSNKRKTARLSQEKAGRKACVPCAAEVRGHLQSRAAREAELCDGQLNPRAADGVLRTADRRRVTEGRPCAAPPNVFALHNGSRRTPSSCRF